MYVCIYICIYMFVDIYIYIFILLLYHRYDDIILSLWGKFCIFTDYEKEGH